MHIGALYQNFFYVRELFTTLAFVFEFYLQSKLILIDTDVEDPFLVFKRLVLVWRFSKDELLVG